MHSPLALQMPPWRTSVQLLWLATVLICGVKAVPAQESDSEGKRDRPFDPAYYRVRTWTAADGLGGNWIECLHQTRDGFLWIGTPEGLVRFDGFRFTRLNRANCPAFDSVVVKALAEDTEGALWVATKRGVLRFQGKEVRRFDVEDGLAGQETAGLCASRNGGMWVATSGGVNLFRNGQWRSFTRGQGDLRFVHAVLEDRDGRVWVGQPEGLWQLDPATGQFSPIVPSLSPPPPGAAGAARSLFQDQAESGALWIGMDSGVYRWRGGQIELVSGASVPPNGWVKSVRLDADERRWAVIGFSLHCWTGAEFVPVDDHFGLIDQVVNCILEDASRNLWIGSRFGGLTRLRPTPVRLFSRKDGLRHSQVRGVAVAADGAIWVTTAAGLDRLDNGRLEPLPENLVVHGRSPVSIVATRDREIWIGTGEQGAFVLSQRDGRWSDAQIISTVARCVTMVEDRDSDVWFGGPEGLNRYTRGKAPLFLTFSGLGWQGIDRTVLWTYAPDRVEQLASVGRHSRWHGTGEERVAVDTSPDRAEELRHAAEAWAREAPQGQPASYDIRGLTVAREGGIWLGTARGLSRLRDWQFEDFPSALGTEAESIRCLYEDDDANLWLGTDAGLIRFHNGRFTLFGPRHGLLATRVVQILADDYQHLWLGCPQGIVRVAREELHRAAQNGGTAVRLLLLDESAGLRPGSSEGLGHPSACRSRDGRLWFATSHGLAVVDPLRAHPPPDPTPASIDKVVARGVTVWERDSSTGSAQPAPNAAPHLRLPPGSGHSLEVHYSALELTAPENVTFQQRLQGLDSDWINVGGQRVVHYSSLPPGKYRFQVARGDPLGRWDSSTAELALTLVPAFYQTVWFWAGGALGWLALGYLAREYRARFQQRLSDAQRELALERQRSQIARDLHDGLGATVSQIALAARACRAELPPQHPAVEPLEQIAEAHRRTEEALDEVHWATYPKYDTLRSLVIRLRRYAADYLNAAGIPCQIELPEEELERKITAEVRYQLLLAVKEALRNIVRHAAASHVELVGTLSASTLTLRIKDNGRGFDPQATPETGNGLLNMRSRMAEIHGHFSIVSQPGAGTTIELSAPLDAKPGNFR